MGEMSRLLWLQKVLHVAATELATDTNYKKNFSDVMTKALFTVVSPQRLDVDPRPLRIEISGA